MKKQKRDLENEDDGSQEWTETDFANAMTFDQLPKTLQEKLLAINEIGRSRGRPKKENPKQEVKLRVDPEVLSAFKATGRGWQTRMNQALKEWIAAYNPSAI
jgi:uncharacterized protein (DUF4415 family)